jgi:DNA end-binding protein Ku
LRKTGKIAIGQVVIGGQERIVAMQPSDKGLLANSLRYEDEIRKPDEFFSSIAAGSVDEDELAMMEQIIARKSRKFEPGKFFDHYQAAVRELIDKKLEGKLPDKAPERKPAQVINLMDALKRSLAEEDKSGGSARRRDAGRAEAEAASAKPAARGKKAAAPSGQRNLLLPVEGGRGGRAAQGRTEREAPAEVPKRRRKAS